MMPHQEHPLRIVHLTSAHAAHDNRIFDRECRFLAGRGYRVTLVVPHDRDTVLDNVRIQAVPRPSSRLQRISRTLVALYRRAIEEDADLYHFHDPELIPVGVLLRRSGKKVVYDVHEDYPNSLKCSRGIPAPIRGIASSFFKHVERHASRRFSALIGAGAEITNRISSYHPVTITIGNYPALKDYPFTPSFGHSRYSSGVLASFGGISGRTCTRAIVEALALIPDEVTAHLFLGGGALSDGPSYSEITRMPGWNRVTYMGEIPVSAMLERLLTASLEFVLFSPEPNNYGVRANRFFEALAAGLPVITSDFPKWKEVVNGAGCGLTVNPTDPHAIAEAVVHLLTHPADAAEMGRRGYELATREFNWELESCKLEQLYKQLLDGCALGSAGPAR